MPIPSTPSHDHRRPKAPDVLELAAATLAEPAIPFWRSLLRGISRWLNRLFLGLVLALVGFTFWHWWQE